MGEPEQYNRLMGGSRIIQPAGMLRVTDATDYGIVKLCFVFCSDSSLSP